MSQRSEKLHRQVAQLRSDVDALQVAWLSQQHCDAVELAAAAERTRQAHRRASEARRAARAWKLNAILTLILAALIAAVALVISAKAAEEPTTPDRIPGDDTPATTVCYLAPDALWEPEEAENERIEAALLAKAHEIDGVTVTHYDTCVECCGKTDGITASGVLATPGVTVAVDPDVIPLGSDVLVDYGDGEIHYYRADDVGGAIKGNRIDLCVGSHAEALQLGRRTATVYWVAQEE